MEKSSGMHIYLTLFMVSTLATLFMTAFSYLYAYLSKDNFKEPQLLNLLLTRISGISIHKKSIVGWILHFIFGIIFTVILYLLWENFIQPNWINTLLIGIIAGIIGSVGWKIFFALHPNPPKIKFVEYSLQLIFAHIVFSYTCFVLLSKII